MTRWNLSACGTPDETSAACTASSTPALNSRDLGLRTVRVISGIVELPYLLDRTAAQRAQQHLRSAEPLRGARQLHAHLQLVLAIERIHFRLRLDELDHGQW